MHSKRLYYLTFIPSPDAFTVQSRSSVAAYVKDVF